MIRIDLSVRRIYVAAFAAIGYAIAHRSISSFDWTAQQSLWAIASDAAVLAALFFCFSILDRLFQPDSLAARGHRALHFGIALGIVAIATGAQALYQKTGEILDLGILSFFIMHFRDLTGATQSVIDTNILFLAVACFGFYFLALIKTKGRVLKALQYALFLSPLLLLFLDLADDFDAEQTAFIAPTREKDLYKGKYADLTTTQKRWFENQLPFWRQGILSGLSASAAHSLSEFQFLEENSSSATIYTPPKTLSPPANTPSILLVILESARFDAIGAYSVVPTTVSNTPFIDSLANSGWLFERTYTTVPHTSKALVGIYCGTFAKIGTNSFESTESNYPITCLPKLLAQLGYGTGHFQTAPGTFEERSRFLKNAGFEHAVVQEDLNPDQQEKFGYLGLDDRLLTVPMLEWMQRQRRDNRPFLASVLTVMTHHPYVSPGNVAPLSNPAEGKHAYLRAIRYTDDVVRDLIEGMRKRKLLENTIVIVTGDHGEGFAEHGQVAHNGTAYEEGMRVPLIVYAPWLLHEPKRATGLRQHIDIMPTIFGLLGSTHDGALPGKDLLRDPDGHDELITSCFYDNYCLNHYQKDGSKLAYFFGKRPTELYDLDADPSEQKNLAPHVEPQQIKSRIERSAALRKSYSQIYSD